MTQNNNHVWVILTEDDYRCVNCDIRHAPAREHQECSYQKTTQHSNNKEAYYA